MQHRPFLLDWRSSKAFIIFVVVFAVFTDIFLYGLIVPVTPTALRDRVGLSENEVQRWTSILLALYGAALLAFSPIAGYIADRIQSRYWPLMTGLFALAAATALLCVGTHMALWVVGRLCQGASAAVVWSVGCALLVDTVDPSELGQSLGYIGSGITLGMLGGPLLGGVLYQHGGYYAVFGLAFGFVGLDIVFRVVMIEKRHAVQWMTPEEKEKDSKKDEEKGPVADTAPVIPPIPALFDPAEADKKADESRPSTLFSSGSASPRQRSLSPPTRIESSASHPTSTSSSQKKPVAAIVTLMASERMLVSLWGYFVVAVILTAMDSVLPLFVKSTFSWGQTGQGLIFVPITVPHVLDPVVGYLNDRFERARRYMAAAALFAIVPVFVCFRYVDHNSMQQKIVLCALLALLGLCLAVVLPPLMMEASLAVQEKEDQSPGIFGKGGAMAFSFGMMNAAFAAGSIVGPFLAGYIREAVGWATMGWALALLAGVSGVPILVCFGGFFWRKRRIQSGGGE